MKTRIPIVKEVISGIPVRSIMEYAATDSIDLIVMGTSQRGAINRYFLGSISTSLIGNAKCPVFIVPRTRIDGEGEM